VFRYVSALCLRTRNALSADHDRLLSGPPLRHDDLEFDYSLSIHNTKKGPGLDRADKLLRMFKAPGTLDRNWAKAELLADMELST
jgi:hypothetical protein